MWEIEAHITFKGKGGPVKVSQILPHSQSRFSIIDQAFVYPGYGLSTISGKPDKQIVFSKRKVSGEQNLYYRFTVLDKGVEKARNKRDIPKAKIVDWTGARLVSAKAILDIALAKSADKPTLISAVVEQLRAKESASHVSVLLGKNKSLEHTAEIVAGILSLEKISARSVHGIVLHHSHYQPGFSHWLELFDQGAWRPYSLTTGQPMEWISFSMVARFYTFCYRMEGGKKPKSQTKLSLGAKESASSSPLNIFQMEWKKHCLAFPSFLFLWMFNRYTELWLWPLWGALLLVFLRNVIGIGTFGTFMPVLMAMSFRETELIWGLLLFSIIIAISLIVRIYFESLKLLVVPRLAAVLIVVIFSDGRNSAY